MQEELSPGPWHTSEDDGMLVIVDRDGETLCTIGALNETDSTWRPTDQANACAMAGAWRLLMGCEALLGIVTNIDRTSDPALHEALRQIRSGVDQARGR